MRTTLRQVVLSGSKTLWLAGEREGALCSTPEDFAHGRESYAHLFEDGRIMRFQHKIGEFSDLNFTGTCEEVEQGWDAFAGLVDWAEANERRRPPFIGELQPDAD